MQKTKIASLFPAALLGIVFVVFSACSLIPSTGEKAGRGVAINLTISVPDENGTASRALGVGRPRVILPETTVLKVTMSGAGLETPLETSATKNPENNTISLTISDVPLGTKNITVAAGITDSGTGNFTGLTVGSVSGYEVTRGTNIIPVSLAPVDDIVRETVLTNDVKGASVQIGTVLGKTVFYKIANQSSSTPPEAVVMSQGSYRVQMEIHREATGSDPALVRFYNGKGLQIEAVGGATELGESYDTRNFYIDSADAGQFVYVAVTYPSNYAIPGDFYYVSALPKLFMTSGIGANVVLDDVAPMVFDFNVALDPSSTGQIVATTSSGDFNTGSTVTSTIASATLSGDNKTLTLQPSSSSGWALGNVSFALTNVKDKYGNSYAVNLDPAVITHIGRNFYVDPGHSNPYVGTSPGETDGRKERPFKYLDDLLSGSLTKRNVWFHPAWNPYGSIKVASYRDSAGSPSTNVLQNGKNIELDYGTPDFYTFLRIEGAYTPNTWIRDFKRPSLWYAGAGTPLSEGERALRINGLTGVEVSGFYIKRNAAATNDTENALVELYETSDTYLHDNVLEQVQSSNPTGAQSTHTLYINDNYSAYVIRNSIIGAQHTVNTGGQITTHGIFIHQPSHIGAAFIANNVIESGNIVANAALLYNYVYAVATESNLGQVALINNTLVAGSVSGSTTTPEARAAISFGNGVQTGADALVVANNLILRTPTGSAKVSTLQDAAIVTNGSSLPPVYAIALLYTNIFSDWATNQVLLGNSSSTQSSLGPVNAYTPSYAGGTIGNNLTDTLWAQDALLGPSNDAFSDWYDPDGVGSSPAAAGGFSVTSNLAYKGAGAVMTVGAPLQSVFNTANLNNIFKAAYYDQVKYDRNGVLRTGNGSTGWTPGAYEQD